MIKPTARWKIRWMGETGVGNFSYIICESVVADVLLDLDYVTGVEAWGGHNEYQVTFDELYNFAEVREEFPEDVKAIADVAYLLKEDNDDDDNR